MWTVYHTNHRKTVCILNVLNDAVSIHLLYRNALDIQCKHTASQLHVAERVLWPLVCCWISSDKRHTWTKHLHCVTSADVSWVDHVFWNHVNSVYMSTALHQCEYEHDASVHCVTRVSVSPATFSDIIVVYTATVDRMFVFTLMQSRTHVDTVHMVLEDLIN